MLLKLEFSLNSVIRFFVHLHLHLGSDGVLCICNCVCMLKQNIHFFQVLRLYGQFD